MIEEGGKFLVTDGGIEIETGVDLTDVSWVEVEWSAVGFVEIIRVIHEVVKLETVTNPKSVVGLVGDHLHLTIERDDTILFIAGGAEGSPLGAL